MKSRIQPETIQILLQCLTPDLRLKRYQDNPNPLAGHCYVACEALYHLSGKTLKPCVMRVKSGTHWFLLRPGSPQGDPEVIDPTAGQFDETPDYSQGRGCGFLTSQPSKRTKIVLKKMKKLVDIRINKR